MKDKYLKINDELFLNWVVAEKSMQNFEGDWHCAAYFHRKIGECLFGENLPGAIHYVTENIDTDAGLLVQGLSKFVSES